MTIHKLAAKDRDFYHLEKHIRRRIATETLSKTLDLLRNVGLGKALWTPDMEPQDLQVVMG